MSGLPGPTVVGALGGSGTRVVAQILMEVGLHLGTDLNPPLDNLWFTLLFKRPRWYADVVTQRPAEIATGLDVLAKAMAGSPQWTSLDRAFIRKAMLHIAMHGHDHNASGRGIWPILRAQRLRSGGGPAPDNVGWGWKEPNSHIYLPQLIEHFPDLKFIYVARHGLDMAYSSNRAQLYNWGPLFGIEPPRESGAALADAMLAWWVAATRRCVDVGAQLGERFLLLDYDALCREPTKVLPELLAFLGVSESDERVARLAKLPRAPSSIGRYRQQPWRELDDANVAAVREFGFAIED